MRILARGLNNAGFTVYAVQLAGHCGTLNDLLESTWQEWLASVRAGADKTHGKGKETDRGWPFDGSGVGIGIGN